MILRIIKAKLRRLFNPPISVEDRFHSMYYYSKVWADTYFMGKKIFKCPNDMWIYQEIFWEIKPNLVIETGTFHGGSALYFAKLMDLMDIEGKVITIDVDQMPDLPQHEKIIYIKGSSTDNNVIQQVKEHAHYSNKILAVLDSDHSKEHVLRELEIYHDFVTKDSYIVVEDSNINGHPVHSGWGTGPGPYEAIEEFLKTHSEFVIDKSREKFILTFNPNGWLRRVG